MFLKISDNSQENTCVRVSFNKVAGLTSATLLKRMTLARCFPVNQSTFFYRTSPMAASEERFINPFQTTDLFLHLLKTWEKQRFSDVFRGYKKRLMTWHGLKVKGKIVFKNSQENDVKVLEYNVISCQFTAAILSVSSYLCFLYCKSFLMQLKKLAVKKNSRRSNRKLVQSSLIS